MNKNNKREKVGQVFCVFGPNLCWITCWTSFQLSSTILCWASIILQIQCLMLCDSYSCLFNDGIRFSVENIQKRLRIGRALTYSTRDFQSLFHVFITSRAFLILLSFWDYNYIWTITKRTPNQWSRALTPSTLSFLLFHCLNNYLLDPG